MLEQIMEIAKETFSDGDITASSKIEDGKGFDSMALVQFIIELETNLGVTVDEDEVNGSMTYEELADFLKGRA